MRIKRVGIALCVCMAAVSAACSNVETPGNGDPGPGGVSLATQPAEGAPLPRVCDLVEEDTVAEIFGGHPRGARPGSFPGTCSYTLEDRPGLEVLVSDMGRPRQWSRVRQAAAATRGGVDDLAGLGAKAFVPRDSDGREVVVRTGNMIVAIAAAGPITEPGLAASVEQFARKVARSARGGSSAR